MANTPVASPGVDRHYGHQTRRFPSYNSAVRPGCQSYVPVSVQVLDAETGTAIAGARVESRIIYGMTPFAPKPSAAVTDHRGRGVVRISDTAGASSRGVRAASPGYLEATAFIPEDRFRHLRGERRPSGAVARSPAADLTVKLYRQPHPYFVFVVPNGYRGLLKLDQSSPTTESDLSPSERAVEVAVRPPVPQKLP